MSELATVVSTGNRSAIQAVGASGSSPLRSDVRLPALTYSSSRVASHVGVHLITVLFPMPYTRRPTALEGFNRGLVMHAPDASLGCSLTIASVFLRPCARHSTKQRYGTGKSV